MNTWLDYSSLIPLWHSSSHPAN